MSDNTQEKEQITINDKPVTKEQLEQKREELKEQAGVEIVEVKKNTHRIHING